jgi:hypothetical protein
MEERGRGNDWIQQKCIDRGFIIEDDDLVYFMHFIFLLEAAMVDYDRNGDDGGFGGDMIRLRRGLHKQIFS